MNRRQRYLAALRDYRARPRWFFTPVRVRVWPIGPDGIATGPGLEVEVERVTLQEAS